MSDRMGQGSAMLDALRAQTLGASPVGGSSAALGASSFLVLAADASLAAERVLTPGTGLTAVDSGAGAAYTLSVDGTVARSTWAVIAGAGLTGGGNLAAAGVTLDVGAGVGITVAANSVAVDQSTAFAWTGAQTWANTATFNGTLAVIGGVASNLTPTLTDTYDLGTSLKLWRKGWLSELDAILFAQNVVTVVGGWIMVSKGEGVANADITAGATSVDLGTTAAIATNDFILFRAAGQVEYMQVTGGTGPTWTVTRNLDGSGANAWPAGSVFVNLGNTGNGRIELNANSTPRISIMQQGATYNAQTERARLGDLNGNWGYVAETYGLALGEYATSLPNITIDATNGLRMRIFNGTPVIQFDTSGNADITNKLRLPGASSALTIGATPPTSAAAGTGLWLDRTGLYSLNAGVQQIKIDATTGKLVAGGTAVTLDVNGLAILAPSGTGTLWSSTAGVTWNTSTGFEAAAIWAKYGGTAGSPLGLLTLEVVGGGAPYIQIDANTPGVLVGGNAFFNNNVSVSGSLSGTTGAFSGDVTLTHAALTGGPNLVLDGAITDGSAYLGAVAFKISGVDTGYFAQKEHSANSYGLEWGTYNSGGPTTKMVLYGDGGLVVGAATGGTVGAGTINIHTGLYVDGSLVVGPRHTGWGTPTATLLRNAITNADTLAQTISHVAALVTDLRTHGLIGT